MQTSNETRDTPSEARGLGPAKQKVNNNSFIFLSMSRTIQEIKAEYTRLKTEWEKLDAISVYDATISEMARCDRIGDRMSDLEIEAGGYQHLK